MFVLIVRIAVFRSGGLFLYIVERNVLGLRDVEVVVGYSGV